MRGQKSIFSKYFIICVACVTLSVVVLGVVLLFFSTQHFRNERYALLSKNAKNAASITVANYASNSFDFINYQTVHNGYKLLAIASDTEIFFTDVSGKTLVCSHDSSCVHTTYTVSTDVVKHATKGEYSEMGRLDGMYKTPYYTVGIPVKVNENTTIGVIFVSSSAKSMTDLTNKFTKTVVACILMILFIAFVLVYAATAQLVRPMRQMVKATRSFSKGDFTQRISVSDDREIGELALSFNNMAEDLALLESSHRSFVANVSHELKTPMTAIIGFVEGILDGTIPPEQHEHYLNIVLDESKRLSTVVRSMLNIARIETGENKLDVVSFDINDVVCQALFPFEKKIEEKNLDIRGLDIDTKVMVDADKGLVHQVVYNLIDNAVKFADVGGYIEFRYIIDKNTTYISVVNSGEGISQEECRYIFDRFYKTDKSRSSDKQGVGLGLHIAKSIVKLHGGDIRVRSEQGKYTEFCFTLPASQTKNHHK